MPIATTPDGIELYYEVKGSSADPTILLVMGFTAQLTAWPEGFVDGLTSRGYQVVSFDNRDCGLSSKSPGMFEGAIELLFRAQAGEDVSADAPYTLSDMANDAVAVMDAVEVDAAHIIGASMGGMIAQHMAIEHPDRVLSLTSIMSTTGNGEVGNGDPEVMGALLTPAPLEREASIAYGVEVNRLISGPLWDRALSEERTAENWDRSFHPAGATYQIAAIAASGDRTEKLASVKTPTLVLHGRADKLISYSGGVATADAIPEADLLILGQMGHDLPEPLWAQALNAIEANTRRRLVSP